MGRCAGHMLQKIVVGYCCWFAVCFGNRDKMTWLRVTIAVGWPREFDG